MARFTIQADNPDFSGTREGVDFRNGKGATDDRSAALNLQRRGFEVSGLGSDEPAEAKPLSRMTTAELEAVAKAEEIDLSEAKTNPERVQAIEAAREKGSDK